jgi:inosine-uridine nucleoside N-ribohydrolase
MSIKILLDTDIGSDIDDAVCLAYLLANAKCELLGITTVSGEAERRASLASAMCKVAKQDVPIYPGRADPLLITQKQPQAPQANALSRWPHETNFPKGEAVEFLRRTIRAHPGEIILLAIGPLTNVAALFAADDEIPSLLKGLVMMCGMFTEHATGNEVLEWNARLDPTATAIVYHEAVKMHRSIGLEVTHQVTLPAALVRERFQKRLLQPVLDFAEIFFTERPQITFHDPLAAATIFDETICSFESGQVEVELATERLAGLTRWAAKTTGPHEVARTVNANRFFEHYFSVFAERVSQF